MRLEIGPLEVTENASWVTRRILRDQKLGAKNYWRVRFGLERTLTLSCGHHIMARAEFNGSEVRCYFCWKEGRK